MKLSQKYTSRVVHKVIKYLEDQCYFDNNLYIDKLKDLCIKKYYGIRRFKKILNEKGIYNKEDCYTFEEEAQVLDKFLDLCYVKYGKLEREEYFKKINYLVKYKGYSTFNISKFIEG